MDTITIFILLSTLWFQHLTFSLDCSDYVSSSFTNPVQSLEFTHFTTHHETGTVYIGASDALYQLASDFTIQEKVDTAVSECEGDVNECPNHNKILLIDYAHDRLISCGGENVGQPFGGTCKTRDLVDITRVLDNPDKLPVVASGMLTTEAIIAPGVSGNNTLYVAATPEAKRKEHVFILSRRNLNDREILLFNTEDEYTKLSLSSSSSSFYINYVSSFVTNGYTYFVTHQTITESNFISKIHRVCHNSNTFHSFTEITIECQGQNKTVYNLIQAAYVGAAGTDLVASLGVSDGDDVFYGVFAKSEASGNGYVPSMQSALCVFSLQDIENAFFKAVAGCVGGNYNMGMSSVDHQVNYLLGSDGGCPGHSVTDTQVRGQICTATNWKYAKSIIPLESDAVIEWSDAIPSSIITATHRQHTIAFVGTTKGNMVKVHVMDNTNGREYERFSVANHVLRDVEKDQEELTILTTQQLLRLRVENCGQYKSCDECIGVNGEQDGDPYCGWCTLEKRCTRYNACLMSNTTSRWLSYNSSKCIVISKVTPYDRLPVTETEQQITMMVEQLPGLSIGNSYQCIFGDLSSVPASTFDTELTCTAPDKSKLPKIQSNADYLTIQLYVYSTETKLKFVQTDIFFYECNTHQGCIACTNSSWACDWCIYSNKCVYDNSTCSDDYPSSIINGINNPEISNKQGYQECPQLAVHNEEILVPNGISKPISVTGINLPDENKATSYTCILNIEGDESKTDATRSGNMFTCEARMYTYMANVSDLNVALYVVWKNNRRLDDVHGFIVTLYKCDVGRPDCSRCLSNLSTRPELNCGWCSVDQKCTVQGSSDCNAGWMSSATNVNCPNPYLLEVQPSSGPLNGNTTIVISGTDLGKQFSDVTTIKVGTKDCNKNRLEDRYMAGSSVSCRTMSGTNNSVEDITVTIRGANGDIQESTGEVKLTYRDPSISSFEPREGLTAGGTVVTISGQYLDACSEISATIGSQCIMNRMDDVINATTAYCRTTSSPLGTSHKLTLLFDGTKKQSVDTFTYRPNPVVSAVQPLKTIESGGITLMVEGTGFELAQTPHLVMYVDDEQFIEDCVVRNNTLMLCQTPNIKVKSENISRQKRAARGKASFGFVIGDVADLLKWSDDNNASMEYYDDPKYELFGTNPQLKHEDILLINGSNLNDGSSKIDVIVYIGKEKAVTTSLANRFLTIELPKMNPERVCINGTTTAYPCVVVYHGNLVFYLGMLRYPAGSSNLTITLISCVIVVLVVLIIVILVCYVIRDKRFLKDRDAVILEKLRLLQKLVEEEIDNLAAESSPAQSFIILPNNMQINSQDVKIRYTDLSIGRKLGHGAFGEVCHAILTTGGMSHQVAGKSIQGTRDASTIFQFLEEGLIMKDFDHPNVLGLVGLTFDPDGNPLVVLPFMINGDLRSFMKKTTVEITSKQKLNFAIEAAKGMAYLTKKKFVHRDIAARNCMVDDKLVVKIGDFGRSRDMEEADYYTSGDMKAKLPVKWMAPESLDKRVYNEKTDVWSYGVLLWEIFTNGKKPYRTIANKDVYYYITSGNRLPCPEDCREDVYDIMMQCWKSNPKERIGFQELSLRFITVLSLYTYAWTDEEPGLIGEQGVSNMNPLEERKVQDDESSVKVSNRDSYLHPVEENNEAVSIEMQNMNPM